MNVEIDGLDGFTFSTEVAAYHDCKTGTSKSIIVTSKIVGAVVYSLFVVLKKGKKVVSCSDLGVAIEFYNEIN